MNYYAIVIPRVPQTFACLQSALYQIISRVCTCCAFFTFTFCNNSDKKYPQYLNFTILLSHRGGSCSHVHKTSLATSTQVFLLKKNKTKQFNCQRLEEIGIYCDPKYKSERHFGKLVCLFCFKYKI